MSVTPLHIAIVDDEEPVRKALRRLLNSAGAVVETFASGHDFLASLASHQPDCLILDLHLPGMSGREIQRNVAAVQPSLPVIVITGKDEPGARESILAAGARSYILKPLDEVTLLTAVAAAARWGTAETSPTPPSA